MSYSEDLKKQGYIAGPDLENSKKKININTSCFIQLVYLAKHVSAWVQCSTEHLVREAFSQPYISFFHLLVNGVSVTCLPPFFILMTNIGTVVSIIT